MSQVTYRGVKYDTARQHQTSPRQEKLSYRGVKFVKEVK